MQPPDLRLPELFFPKAGAAANGSGCPPCLPSFSSSCLFSHLSKKNKPESPWVTLRYVVPWEWEQGSGQTWGCGWRWDVVLMSSEQSCWSGGFHYTVLAVSIPVITYQSLLIILDTTWLSPKQGIVVVVYYFIRNTCLLLLFWWYITVILFFTSISKGT